MGGRWSRALSGSPGPSFPSCVGQWVSPLGGAPALPLGLGYQLGAGLGDTRCGEKVRVLGWAGRWAAEEQQGSCLSR